MRIIGIDYGDTRIGVALSDPMGMIAGGVGNIINRGEERAADELARFIKEQKVSKIVLGFPKNMNGTVGARGEKSIAFANKLSRLTGLDVVLWDERLTTVAAHKTLNEANVRGKKRKNAVDSMAASLILQGYLDSLK